MKKNQCVITVINNFVKLGLLVLVNKFSFPHLSDLQIIETEEKEFRLNVDGQRVSLKADHLAEQNLFRKAMIDQVYVSPPKLKPEDFRTLVQNLLDNKEIVKAPQGSSKIDQLGQHLENYCTSLTAAEGSAKEDIENGNMELPGTSSFFFHIFLSSVFIETKMGKQIMIALCSG